MAQDLATEFVADLYARERSGLARSVARIAGESHAEDLVHDAFVAYLTKSPWATKPGAWVATVARNRALNELRRPKLVPLSGSAGDGSDDLTERIASDVEPPAADAEREAIRSVVASALSALPDRALTAIRMKFFENADYQHIADALGVRIPQAHVVVHRALRRLGRELVHRMAEAHGAATCAPALLKMAGLGTDATGLAGHADEPCPMCRPAWDEIVALRIGGWVPLPLVAFRETVRSLLHKLAGRSVLRNPLIAEPASRAATAFVALGVAASSMAPAVAASPSAPRQAIVRVSRPAAGNQASTVAGGAGTPAAAKAAATASRPHGSSKDAAPPHATTVGSGSHVTTPNQSGDGSSRVSNDQSGQGLTVCTDPTQPCD